jgi:AcrR family transcriptional regulator
MINVAEERPVRKDVARNRARLLQAADEVFAARGGNATLDDIARHAGVGVATAYRHFANKQALLEAMFAQRLEQIVELLRAAEAEDDPRAALESFLYRLGELQSDDKGMREAMASSPALDKSEQIRNEVTPGISLLFDRAKAAGVLRPECEVADIGMVVHMLGAASEFSDERAPQLWRRYLDLLLDGLFAEGQPRHAMGVPALTLEQALETVQRIQKEKARR